MGRNLSQAASNTMRHYYAKKEEMKPQAVLAAERFKARINNDNKENQANKFTYSQKNLNEKKRKSYNTCIFHYNWWFMFF